MQTDDTIEVAICEAIDAWHAVHPDLTVNQIFAAMRVIHKRLSAAAEAHGQSNVFRLSDYRRD